MTAVMIYDHIEPFYMTSLMLVLVMFLHNCFKYHLQFQVLPGSHIADLVYTVCYTTI